MLVLSRRNEHSCLYFRLRQRTILSAGIARGAWWLSGRMTDSQWVERGFESPLLTFRVLDIFSLSTTLQITHVCT